MTEKLFDNGTALLNSKFSSCSSLLSPVNGNAVREVIDWATATGVDLRDTKVVKKPQGHYAK